MRKKNINLPLTAFAWFLSATCVLAPYRTAMAEVVVVPILLDAALPAGGGNVITVASTGGDYTDLREAIEAIDDASATNPYTVVLAAEEFAIGSEPLVLKPHVTLIGQGRDATYITGNVSAIGVVGADSSLVVAAEETTLRSLSVQNVSQAAGNGAALHAPGVKMSLSSVRLDQSNGVQAAGFHAGVGTEARLEDVEILSRSDAGSAIRGIYAQTSDIDGRDLTVTTFDSSQQGSTSGVTGIALFRGTLRLSGGTITLANTEGNAVDNIALYAEDAEGVIENVDMEVSGALTRNAGVIANGSGNWTLRNVQVGAIDGSSQAISISSGAELVTLGGRFDAGVALANEDADGLVAVSSVVGGAVSGGVTCVAATDGNGSSLDSACQ